MPKLICNDDNFIAKGTHKKTYQHPHDASLCIKIPYGDGGEKDLKRELKYRALRSRRRLSSTILPAYHGKVNTNHGEGHAFELIQDYDAAKPLTLRDYMSDEALFIKNFDMLLAISIEFKKALFNERVITLSLFPENLMIQRMSESKKRIMLVNDMGSEVLIPLEYFIDFFTVKKISRRWEQFINMLNKNYPSATMRRFAGELLRDATAETKIGDRSVFENKAKRSIA